MTLTYILALEETNSSSSQVAIPCVANSFIRSTSTSQLPDFISYVDAQSDWNESNSSAIGFIKNKPSLNRIQASASRSLNSVFQINASRDSLVNYSIDISCSLSLTSGQSGTVFLEIASNSGFTTNVQEIARFSNANSGTLTIGLNLIQAITGTLSGYVPLAYYCRLRTSNVVGTPTFTYRSGQEILL